VDQSRSSPVFLEEEMPMTERASSTIVQARGEISDILQGKDHRLLVVWGLAPIHDTKAAREYADSAQDRN